MNRRGLALDAWLMAIPDNVYDLCPCGCGTKWRYVQKGGEASMEEHQERFITTWLENNKDTV